MTTTWKSFTRGSARVSFGKPYYGNPKIIANAPLSRNGFDYLIAALNEAKDAYDEQDDYGA